MKSIYITTSWDDGHQLDITLASLLKKYGITGTFYLAPFDQESAASERLTDTQIKELSESFEIGAHTMTHRFLPTLSLREAETEIVESKRYLENLLAKPVTSFCYPAGQYTKAHVALVQKAGFWYARTVKRFCFANEDSPFETATSVHTYDHWLDIWPLLRFVRYNPITFFRLYRKWDKQAMAMFDYVLAHGGIFHLWGHSWEVDGHGDWERLEAVLAYMSGHTTAHYVTNSELIYAK